MGRRSVEADHSLQGLAEVAERRGAQQQAMEYLGSVGELFSRYGAKLYLDQVLAEKQILKAELRPTSSPPGGRVEASAVGARSSRTSQRLPVQPAVAVHQKALAQRHERPPAAVVDGYGNVQ